MVLDGDAQPRGGTGQRGLILAGVTAVHYAMPYDSLAWLLVQRGREEIRARKQSSSH